MCFACVFLAQRRTTISFTFLRNLRRRSDSGLGGRGARWFLFLLVKWKASTGWWIDSPCFNHRNIQAHNILISIFLIYTSTCVCILMFFPHVYIYISTYWFKINLIMVVNANVNPHFEKQLASQDAATSRGFSTCTFVFLAVTPSTRNRK